MIKQYIGNLEFMIGNMKANKMRGKDLKEDIKSITNYYISLYCENKITTEEFKYMSKMLSNALIEIKGV